MSSAQLTNNEAQGLCLANAFTQSEHVLNLGALVKDLATWGLPAHQRTRLGGKISLGKDVVREVRQALTLEVRQVEAESLGRGMEMPGMHVFIVHPNGQWDIRCIHIHISSLQKKNGVGHGIPMMRRSAVSGVLPAPRASRS